MAINPARAHSANPEPAIEFGHTFVTSICAGRKCWVSSLIRPIPCAACEAENPIATAMQMTKAKICAPRMGRVTRSIAALRRRSCARHHRIPGETSGAAAAAVAREALNVEVTSASSAQERHVAAWMRRSAGAAWGHWPHASNPAISFSHGERGDPPPGAE